VRIVEATPPGNTQSEVINNNRVNIEFTSPGTVGGRVFNCPNSKNYTFDMIERRVQAVRKPDAEYLISRWPSFFKLV